MEILFIGDLHLGKHWLGVDLLKEQRHILMGQILDYCEIYNPKAIVVCGDIFDSIHPRKEALGLWEEFLNSQLQEDRQLFIISGNHDNAAIIEYGSSIFPKSVHISALTKKAGVHVLSDNIRLITIPFVRPVDFGVETYMDAVCASLEDVPEDTEKRYFNILVSHNQFGGLGYQDDERLSNDGVCERSPLKSVFDLVIAGHIHKPEDDGNFHYVGSIMPFTFAEAGQHRCMLFNIEKSGSSFIDLPLKPLYDIYDVEVEHLTDDLRLPVDKYIRIRTPNSDPLMEERLKKKYPLLLKIQRPKQDYTLNFTDMDFKHRTDRELLESYYENILGRVDENQIGELVDRL